MSQFIVFSVSASVSTSSLCCCFSLRSAFSLSLFIADFLAVNFYFAICVCVCVCCRSVDASCRTRTHFERWDRNNMNKSEFKSVNSCLTIRLPILPIYGDDTKNGAYIYRQLHILREMSIIELCSRTLATKDIVNHYNIFI